MENKIFEEIKIKNLLFLHQQIESDFVKSESPDFIKDNLGLEVTQVDTKLGLSFFSDEQKEKQDRLKRNNVKKYNKKYIKAGGRIIRKKSPLFFKPEEFDENGNIYLSASISYDKSFKEALENKLIRLQKYTGIDNCYLAISAPFKITKQVIDDFNNIIQKEQEYDKKYDIIFLITNEHIVKFYSNNEKPELTLLSKDNCNKATELSKLEYQNLAK